MMKEEHLVRPSGLWDSSSTIINKSCVAAALSAIFTHELVVALTNWVQPFFPASLFVSIVIACIRISKQRSIHVVLSSPRVSSPFTAVTTILMITVRRLYHTLSSPNDSSWWLLYWLHCYPWRLYIQLTPQTLSDHPCSVGRRGHSLPEGGGASSCGLFQ